MQILFVAATPFEIQPLVENLQEHFTSISDNYFKKDELEIEILITEVGMTHTAFFLGNLFGKKRFDLAINAGVAGAFDRSLKLGEVVNVVSERFGDLGVEERNGGFTDVHEMSLIDPNQPPFVNGVLYNISASEFEFLPKCKGLTVNKVHGTQTSIDAVLKKYDVQVESMEGAAFFLSCLLAEIPFLEIRAISNYVEPRDREKWDIPLAIENLNQVLIELIESFT